MRLGRLFGVDVELGSSAVLGVALALLAFGSAAMPRGLERLASAMSTLAFGAGVAASAIAHELTRARVARRLGVPVRRVTVFAAGAVFDVEAASARAEWASTAAAVVGSAVIGASFFAVAAVAPSGPAADVARWLALFNVGVAASLFVPAYPLAGGRVVRGFALRAWGDGDEATRVASLGGLACGFTAVAAAPLVSVIAHAPALALVLALGGFLLAGVSSRVGARPSRSPILRSRRPGRSSDGPTP